ncbi:MAG: radical SAM protein [Clostridia bacterium]|nr:radical SAM protein [Clostridia bacterium]
MLKKAYVEITNICNLSCSFCHGASRAPAFMEPEDFRTAANKLRPFTGYIYLHLLGEPLLHPKLEEILGICSELDFKVTVVTNGTLIEKAANTLLSCECLYKVGFSLHSFEANNKNITLEEYLEPICRFARVSSEKGVINVFRLWNGGAQNFLNEKILRIIESFETGDGSASQKTNSANIGKTGSETQNRPLSQNIYLEFADRFSWPDMGANEENPRFCMGLRDQIGVLVDGTAVPCCLDAEGQIKLGNIFSESVESILGCARAKNIVKGFSEGQACEELCRRCGFAKQRFG